MAIPEYARTNFQTLLRADLPLEELCARLVNEAKRAGGGDNPSPDHFIPHADCYK